MPRRRSRQRRVLPLAELRAPFTVSREELRAGDRGAEDVDFDELDAAARNIAVAENKAVFHGWSEAGIEGITEVSPHDADRARQQLQRLPQPGRQGGRAAAAQRHRRPLRTGARHRRLHRVIETAEHGGYPLFDHLRKILGGPIVWSPGVDGAVVVSQRGGDFLFDSGQDLAVGYDHHDADAVHLYIEQSFSFRVATPEAAVAIVPA